MRQENETGNYGTRGKGARMQTWVIQSAVAEHVVHSPLKPLAQTEMCSVILKII